jgi:hypothetical protein
MNGLHAFAATRVQQQQLLSTRSSCTVVAACSRAIADDAVGQLPAGGRPPTNRSLRWTQWLAARTIASAPA